MTWNTAIVTGGAGFIGSHICEELLNRHMAYQVVSIDNMVAGKVSNIALLSKHSNFIQINSDVTDKHALSEIFDRYPPDIIFHNSASKKNISLNEPMRDLSVNAGGTFNMLELANDWGVDRFVHASTGSVYGEGVVLPQTEQHPLNPTSYYGVSKLAGERYVQVFHELYGLPTTILRYFHVFGPRQEFDPQLGGVVSIFANQILSKKPIVIHGNGVQERSFTYVKDVVNANFFVAKTKETNGQVYNCASGINVTVKELADMIMELTHFTVPIKYDDWLVGDIKKFQVSNKKLTDLGFKFETAFHYGLESTIEWMWDMI